MASLAHRLPRLPHTEARTALAPGKQPAAVSATRVPVPRWCNRAHSGSSAAQTDQQHMHSSSSSSRPGPLTTFLWPSSTSASSPLAVSHTRQVRSYEPVMKRSPDLLKAQLVRGSRCVRSTCGRARGVGRCWWPWLHQEPGCLDAAWCRAVWRTG
jgi:hypothetical protein